AVAVIPALGGAQGVHLLEARVRGGGDDELGDTSAGFSPVHLVARVVQVDLDLARVARVDNSRRVQHGQAVLVRESGAGADHAHVARRDGYVSASAYKSSLRRVDGAAARAVQVEAGVRVVRASGGGSPVIEGEKNLQNVCPFGLKADGVPEATHVQLMSQRDSARAATAMLGHDDVRLPGAGVVAILRVRSVDQ